MLLERFEVRIYVFRFVRAWGGSKGHWKRAFHALLESLEKVSGMVTGVQSSFILDRKYYVRGETLFWMQ